MPAVLHPIPDSGPSKQKLLIEALAELSRKLGPGAKLPTSRELAVRLGVTKMTLGRSLAYLQDRGILRCVQGSGIYVEIGAQQRRVALVFGGGIFTPAGSQFGALLLQHCSRRANIGKERFSFFLDAPAMNGRLHGAKVPAHQDLADDLRDRKIDGIILVNRHSEEQEAWLRAQGVPVVCASEMKKSDSADGPNVIFDTKKMIQLGVERLRGAGCRTVGLIGVIASDGEKFQKALRRSKLPFKPKWMALPPEGHVVPVEPHEQRGRRLAKDMLAACGWGTKQADLPDGILITDDIMARGALPFLVSQGILPGKGLKICSHANKGSFVLSEWEDAILRVEFDPRQLAEIAFEMLENLMDGKPQGSQVVAPAEQAPPNRSRFKNSSQPINNSVKTPKNLP